MSRINLPMYWRCRTCAPWEGRRRKSRSATNKLVRQVQGRDFLVRAGPTASRPAPARRRPPACARSCSGAPPRFRPDVSGSLSCRHIRPCYHSGPVESPARNPSKRHSEIVDGHRARQPRHASPRRDLESIIERALEEARARGATQAEAAVSQDTRPFGRACGWARSRRWSTSATAAWGSRCTSGSARARPARRISRRRRCGATVAKACSIARFTAEDACSGLADAALMARSPAGSRSRSSVESQRRARHRDRQDPARPRRSGSIRASTTPRVPRSTPIRDCMSTAIPMASSAAIRRPRIP